MSAKKKRNSVTRCEHCECHYLSGTDAESSGARLRPNTRTSRGGAGGQRNSPLVAARYTPIAGDSDGSFDKVVSASPRTPRTPNTPPSMSGSGCVHGDLWGSDNFTQCVIPRIGVRALAQNLEKRDALLPTELTGWERRHIALINDETLMQLGVLPRTPVALTPNADDRTAAHTDIFILWPCSEVAQLRVSVGESLLMSGAGALDTSRLRLRTVRPQRLASLRLALGGEARDFEKRLTAQKNDHFIYYLRSYLYNAFLLSGQPIVVEFYTRKLQFRIVDAQFAKDSTSNLDLEMNRLSLDSSGDESQPTSGSVEVLSVTVDTDIQLAWSDDQFQHDEDDNIR